MRLLTLIASVWGFACFSRSVNVCRKECNDGGCAYTDESGAYKGCDCRPTNRTGSECESYADACGSETFKPCKNSGKCVSSLGSAYCDCPTGYYGSKCSDLHEDSDNNYPKRPSLLYRTKVRPGEFIITNIIIENHETFKFTLQLSNDAVGTFVNYEEKKSMTTDQYYSICMNKMGSKDFPMNKNMCDFVKATYGDSKITVLNPKPYFMSKTRVTRTDVYFNGDRKAGRMGGTYMISAKVYDVDMKIELLSYNFYHLVVDDELSNCLPFIDPGENCKTIYPALKVKRSEDVPTIKIIVTPDKEVCNKSLEYDYEWKVFDGQFPLHYEDEYHGDVNSKKIINIDDKTLKSRDLVIGKHILPEGPLTLKIKISIKNQENGFKQYVTNRYMCYIDVSLDTLHAEIVGNPVRQVSNFDLVTLDASPSYNPNEPKTRQDQMIYTWYCDIDADEENCREYSTNNPVRSLMAPLNKAKKYVFKLIIRVDNDYIENIGSPKEGTAVITLLPKSFVFDISIKCIKNCGRLASPLEIIYLKAETQAKNCSFEWYYNEETSSEFISTKTIRELNTPHYIFIASKHSLEFNKAYTFKAKDLNSELESSIFIRTAAEPIAGECHVNPSSGIAGTTLFNITCSNFQDVYGVHSLFYYYYEQYESDQDGQGLLIDYGPDKLHSIKLSMSGKISVFVINSFGIYKRVNISVQIFESSISRLAEKFKMMKNELLNSNISATVQMLSLICDIILRRKIKDEFSTLFDTLYKIPSEGCIFCIEQTVLALKKVVHTCSEVNSHKITPTDALAISKNILLKASDLFEYLKTAQNDEVIVQTGRTERIFNSIKNILDILIREVDPIIFKNDTASSMRYFWSSFEHMFLVTRNVEETLKIFGESITLHQVTFEDHKSYESEESYFWANMLNADLLKEENNIIGHNLANELLDNKEIAWGFKIFEINKKLSLWTEQRGHFNHIKSNVKYVALSAHDRHSRKYLGIIDKFVSPASIIFNVTEMVDEFDVEYTIRVPAAGSEQIEFDKAVLVFRLDMMETGAIFITIKKSSHVLSVVWTRNRRPDFKLMSDEQYVTKISVDGYHNLTLQTRKDHQDDIHYIGIFADTVINSSIKHSYDVKFKMNTICMQCLYWKNTSWSSEGMEIGINSSVDGNVHCFTYHFSLFSSSIYVPPNLLNPIDDIHLFSNIANNMVCLILLGIIFITYLVLLYWSYIQDKMDIFMSRIIILYDNYVCEDEVFLVTVYTGHGIGSGTTACVCIELNGTIRSSRVHWLHSLYYRTLQRSNDDWFLIFTPQTLGELQFIRIWHDNHGTSPDWYCQRIVVTEIRSDKTWTFEVERWFSLRRPTENIEHIIYAAAIKRDWKKDTKENVGSGVREKHLWASVFIRHPRSSFTRCQRLSVILCAILSIMLSSMMFYEKLHTDEEEFGKFELRLREFTVAFQSFIVEMVSTFSVLQCFKKGRQIQLNKVVNTRRQKKPVPDNNPRSTHRKIIDFIIGRFMLGKDVYYPANTESIIERHEWNRWLIIGWIYCVTVYIFTTFFIILYGLKFGRIKSLSWLTSITIGIFNGVVVSTPLKIILVSVILAIYSSWRNKNRLSTYNYNLTLNRYRKKTSMLSQDIEFLKLNRKNRRRRFYLPLTNEAVNILRQQRKIVADRNSLIIDIVICSILILTSLCCIYNFNVFDKQNDRYRVNRMVSEYLDHILFESNDRQITLDDLKELLSFKLLKTLHSLELYNGMPITNYTAETIKYDKRGWFGLYHSRLIGGGVSLKQRRVKSDGEDDNESYGPGWTGRVEVNDTTPWTYFAPYAQDLLFSRNSMTADTLAGYDLYLTGGLVESKSIIDQYLKSKWLDAKTRRLNVQFQIYTPNTDLVTIVEIRMITDYGLLYTISIDTETVPASSVIIADRTPYAFTAFAAGAFVAASVACLLACASRPSDGRWTVRTAHDALLAALAVAVAAALRRRLAAMERATAGLAGASGGRVDLWPAFRSHASSTRCVAALTAAALLRLSARLSRRPDRGRGRGSSPPDRSRRRAAEPPPPSSLDSPPPFVRARHRRPDDDGSTSSWSSETRVATVDQNTV